MKYAYSVALGALLCCAGMPVRAEALEVGQPAPSFEVRYDDAKVLRSADLAGSVMIITCESRETKELNQPFKDALLKAFPADERLRRNIALVPVIDCFAYPWPIKGFCVRGVQDNARRLNLQLYVDMSGKMFQDYGAVSSTSTVIIIDRAGVVRYVMPGKIPDGDVDSVVELVRTIAQTDSQTDRPQG
jgi:predicted transcriptional regulator